MRVRPNVIARAEAKQLVTEARSGAFLEMLDNVDIEVNAATLAHVQTDTLNVARRYTLSAYDASYLELAMRLSIPLATLDENLQKLRRKREFDYLVETCRHRQPL